MEPVSLREHRTVRIAVYDADQVDTDRIIPARFLSRISRVGFGELLFADVRGDDFPLDRPEAAGADCLVVGANFGCGSSREHAVWAIQQAGFEAVIAKKTETLAGFSDIFRQNAANCGLWLIELSEADHAQVAAAGSGAEAVLDLPSQSVTIGGKRFSFDIDPATKQQLLAGLDLIGTTLALDGEIAAHEARSSSSLFVPPGLSETSHV